MSAVPEQAGTASLVASVRAHLSASGDEPTPARVAALVRADGRLHSEQDVLDVLDAVRADLAGLGPLAGVVARESVTDVLVNAPDEIWVDRGAGLERVGVQFADEDSLRRFAQRLASSAGRRLDDASPFVDACLQHGVRLHAVLPPVSPRGTCVSLRVPGRRAFGLDDLVPDGEGGRLAGEVLTAVVRLRRAFLVSGGTGSGKTTMLSALLSLANAGERIVLVEDSAELAPRHPHVVRLQARPANVEGRGSVQLRDLVRQALRMRPDRLVVGEVRGAEVVDMLAAMNTGHEGGCGTVHANGAGEVPARLEALAVAAGLTRDALHSQLAAAVDLVLHVRRAPSGRRELAEVCVLCRDEVSGLVRAVPALGLDVSGRAHVGPGHDRLQSMLMCGDPS